MIKHSWNGGGHLIKPFNVDRIKRRNRGKIKHNFMWFLRTIKRDRRLKIQSMIAKSNRVGPGTIRRVSYRVDRKNRVINRKIWGVE